MNAKVDFLSNIECEYKYALNKQYADTFMADLCTKFNEMILLAYHALPQEYAAKHSIEEFKADISKLHRESLSNDYFDTKDDELFKEYRMGLRLRRSDKFKGVEQTIKFKSKSVMSSAAHTHAEFNARSEQDLEKPDLSLFEPGQLPEGIDQVLAGKDLLCKYQTNFERQSLVFTFPYFITFEVAVDVGSIASGKCVSEISEVEFEIKSIDEDFLKDNLNKRIIDLDDIRFEFCTLINELLLLVSGAPTVFAEKEPDKYKSITLGQHGRYCVASDLDYTGFENCQSGSHDVMINQSQEQLISSMPLKEGGLIAMEPLSKLRRAVILKAFAQDNPDISLPTSKSDKVLLSVSKGTRVDLEAFKDALNCYKRTTNPTIELYNQTSYVITDAFNVAVGLANLLGTQEHLKDLGFIISEIIDFACNHKKFRIPEKTKLFHRSLCQDPDLRDLSMLIVTECSNMYLEFNIKMWFEPFLNAYNELLASEEGLSADKFKELSRSLVNNSQSIKTLEYIDRASYILKRKSKLLNFDPAEDYKHIALSTQYHLRQAWNSIAIAY